MADYLITKQGLEEAQKKLLELEKKYKKILSQKGEAAEVGGNVWHDNAAYEDLIRQEQMVSAQISKLKETIRNAQIVEEDTNKEVVGIGSLIILLFEDGRKSEYKITDSLQADPNKNLISYNSPLGSAILGARRGENREFIIGDKKKKIKILEIK